MGNACGKGGDATNFESNMKKAEKMSPAQCKELADTMADAYIKKYDSNNDKELDEAESKEMCGQIGTTVVDISLKIMPDVMIQMMGANKVRENLVASSGTAEIIFKGMDTDGSGTLTKEEISAGLEKFFVTAGVAE